MAFMKPFAEHMTMYEVETDNGTYYVASDVLGSADFHKGGRVKKEALLQYTEGTKIYSARKRTGWYSHLSAPGYMDQTEWQGPYRSRKAALKAVQEQYDVDEEGETVE